VSWLDDLDSLPNPKAANWLDDLDRLPDPGTSNLTEEERRSIVGSMEPRGLDYPIEFGKSVGRGAGTAAGLVTAGFGSVGRDLLSAVGADSDLTELVNLWGVPSFKDIQQAGRSVQKGTAKAIPVTPGMEDSWTRAVGEGAGFSFAAVGPALAAGPAGLAMLGGLASYESTLQQAEELGATPEDARKYARASGLVGAVTEPLGGLATALKIFKRADKLTGGFVGKQILKAATAEALQESVQEIPDETARQAYRKDRTFWDGLVAIAHAGAVGGIVGGLLGGIAIAVKRLALGKDADGLEVQQATATDENILAPLPPGTPVRLTPSANPGDTLLAIHEAYLAAGQTDGTPSKKQFREAGVPEEIANGTRTERAAYIETLKQEKANAEVKTEAEAPAKTQAEAVLGKQPWEMTDAEWKGYAGGWKLHLSTKNPEAVSEELKKLGLRHKVGRGSGQTGKDLTVYVGSKDAADAAANAIVGKTGALLDPPHGDALIDDILFNPKVAGRFNIHDTPLTGEFHQYGAKGIPFLQEDMDPFNKRPSDESFARADKRLRERYGVFYTGTPSSPEAVLKPPGIPPDAAVEAAPPSDVVPLARAVSIDPQAGTSLKHAVVDAEERARGREPAKRGAVITNEFALDEAERRLQADPNEGYRLLESWQADPRPLSKIDQTVILQHKAPIKAAHNKVLRDRIDAERRGDTEALARLVSEDALLSDRLTAIAEITAPLGTSLGQALQARTMVVEETDLSSLLLRKEADLGRELTKPERENVAKISDDLEKTKTDYEASVAKQEEQVVRGALQAKVNEAAAEAPMKVKKGTKRYAKARKEADDALDAFILDLPGPKLFSNPIEPIASFARLVKAYIKLGYVNFAEFVAEVRAKGKERITPEVEQGLRAAWDSERVLAKPKLKKAPTNVDGVRVYARRLLRHYVEDGMRDLDKVTDAVHADLKAVLPGISRTEALHALSGYGDYKPPSLEEVDVAVADLRGQGQLTSQELALKAKQAPERSGKGRHPPTDKQRRIQLRVNELKRRGGYVTTDQKAQQKTWLASQKTRLRNEISDLNYEIGERKRIVRKKGLAVEDDPELKELQKERAAVKARHNKIFGKKQRGKRVLTDEEKVELAEKAAERSIAEVQRQIQGGAPRKAGPKASSTKLAFLRAKRDELKAELAAVRALKNPKMSADERNTHLLNQGIFRRIAKMMGKIASGQVAKEVRTPIKGNAQTDTLRSKYADLRNELARMQERDRRSNLVVKIADFAAELFLRLPRALRTTLDFGVIRRQAGPLFLAEPHKIPRRIKHLVAATVSKKALRRFVDQRTKDKDYALAKRAGLPFTETEGPHSRMEETMASSWANEIPGIKQSNAGQTELLNELRMDHFKWAIRYMGKRGGEVTLDEARRMASLIGDFTGRATGKRLVMAAYVFNEVFFSLRFQVSRFKTLLRPLLAGGVGKGMTPRVRKAMAVLYAKALIGQGVYYTIIAGGLYAAFGLPGKDKYWEIVLDPRSKKVGSFRIGNTWVDVSSGLKRAGSFITQMVSGRRINRRGNVVSVEGDKVRSIVDPTRLDLFQQYVRSSLSPSAAVFPDWWEREDVQGRKVTPGTVLQGLTVPISLESILDALHDQGVNKEDALILLGLLGEGVDTHPKGGRQWESRRP